MQITIKPITPVDYGEAAEISNRAYSFMQKYYTKKEKKMLGRDESAKSIEDYLKNRIGVVAENEHSRVLGFIFWRDYENLVLIGNLAVDPIYQRNGIASNLLRHVEEWAQDREKDAAMLECHKRNKKAHDFYKKLGYKRLEKGIIKSKYPWPFAKNPEDAQVIYEKDL